MISYYLKSNQIHKILRSWLESEILGEIQSGMEHGVLIVTSLLNINKIWLIILIHCLLMKGLIWKQMTELSLWNTQNGKIFSAPYSWMLISLINGLEFGLNQHGQKITLVVFQIQWILQIKKDLLKIPNSMSNQQRIVRLCSQCHKLEDVFQRTEHIINILSKNW